MLHIYVAVKEIHIIIKQHFLRYTLIYFHLERIRCHYFERLFQDQSVGIFLILEFVLFYKTVFYYFILCMSVFYVCIYYSKLCFTLVFYFMIIRLIMV